MKEQFKETYSFKPEISKNTQEILKNREKALDEVKNKYSIHETSTIKRRSNSISQVHQIDEVDEERHETIGDLTSYYKKLESRLDE
jgi:hypothetical protein